PERKISASISPAFPRRSRSPTSVSNSAMTAVENLFTFSPGRSKVMEKSLKPASRLRSEIRKAFIAFTLGPWDVVFDDVVRSIEKPLKNLRNLDECKRKKAEAQARTPFNKERRENLGQDRCFEPFVSRFLGDRS